MISVHQPSSVPAEVARYRALELRRASPRNARRALEKERERMVYSDDIQREYPKYCSGIPLQFTAVASYGLGPGPLTFTSAANIASWHLSTKGLTLGAVLIPTVPTDPQVQFAGNINQNIPLRMDILTGGLRGTATYGLTIDGGLSYFQSGVTATTVFVPALGQSMTMALGTFTALNQYLGTVVSVDNQTGVVRTLAGDPLVTDANRPRIISNAQNGYPSIKGNGGTLGALVDTTSTWAAEVCSGIQHDFTWVFCMADDNATPSSAVPFVSFADNISANPYYAFTVRNGTNTYRGWHVTDSNVTTLREAGTLDTAFHVFVVIQQAGLLYIWVDGVNIVNGLSWGTAVQTTCSNVAIFGSNRGGAQAGTNRFQFLEMMTYKIALPTLEWQQCGSYLKGKYNTP